MNCPVCGTEVINNQLCPVCGANISDLAGVSQDKIIYNQTPEQQLAAGDDSVTQLIPENYMSATGDDNVTQLIPENYMTSQGDDTATVMLDPAQTPQYMPNQQPIFAQAPMGGFQQPGFAQAPMNGFQQPGFNQGGYQQGFGQPVGFNGGGKSVSPLSKYMGLANMILTIVLLVSCVIYLTKPIMFAFQSYYGGVLLDEEVVELVIEQDPDGYEDANAGYQIFVGVAVVLIIIAVLNAWSCYARLSKGCVKSPVNKAVGAFVLGLIGVGIIIAIKVFTDGVIMDTAADLDFDLADTSKFNVYNLTFILGIVSVIVNFINIFTSVAAKKATR